MPNFKSCRYCGQKFGSSSLAIHEQRCRERPEVKAEHELRDEEGYARPPPLPDWQHCPNCGEQYGKVAFASHVRKCVRRFPEGRNGFKADAGAPPAAPAAPAAQSAGLHPDEATATARKLLDRHDRIRAMFDHFDEDHNGLLSREELGVLLRQCFPARCADTEALLAEFAKADADGSGLVDFEEFVGYHNQMAGGANRFDEASDMFHAFDLDDDGHLDRKEFLSLLHQVHSHSHALHPHSHHTAPPTLAPQRRPPPHAGPHTPALAIPAPPPRLPSSPTSPSSAILGVANLLSLPHQVFPEHCDEVDEMFEAYFDAADTDHSGTISFREFCAYYDQLLRLFDDEEEGAPHEDLSAGKTELQPCACGLTFLREKLPAHQRSCTVHKALQDAAAAEKAAAAKAAAAAAAAADEAAAAKAAGLTDSDATSAAGFVNCEYCGRHFFPDRLPVHLRVCKKKPRDNKCRPTTTTGEMVGSVYHTSVGGYDAVAA